MISSAQAALSTPNTNLIRDSTKDTNYDTMVYPYPRYNDELDTTANIHAFLTTWQENRISECLVAADTNASNIDGRIGLENNKQSMIILLNWYSEPI